MLTLQIEIKKAQPRGSGNLVKNFNAPQGGGGQGGRFNNQQGGNMGGGMMGMGMGGGAAGGGGFDPNAMAMMYQNMMKGSGGMGQLTPSCMQVE
jgi:RNA-binding protein Musashi